MKKHYQEKQLINILEVAAAGGKIDNLCRKYQMSPMTFYNWCNNVAKQLVEEWFNRQGFFTVRACRKGHGSFGLLGVRSGMDQQIEGVHCEVHIAFRPVAYVSKLTDADIKKLGVKEGSYNHPKRRPDKMLAANVAAWAAKKFSGAEKTQLRNEVWPDLKNWQMVFVHAKLYEEKELVFMKNNQIKTIHVASIANQLQGGRFNAGLSVAGLGGTEIAALFAGASHKQRG